MIGHIRGTLIEKNPPEVAVEVQGICYEIQVPMTTLFQLPETGQQVALHTHFVVREDAQLLFGFIDKKDKAMFRALIRVNGVGPRMALAILSGMDSNAFVRTVRDNDISALVNMPGIGRKTAERLIVEMRDRLAEWEDADVTEVDGDGTAPATDPASRSIMRDAETALLSLGYKPGQATRAVAGVRKANPEIADPETLIRLALKSLA
ncbi:MAG: Holliday junction branch migration protein RuvA [Pseudohongiellaceae bacterium]